MSNPFQKNPFYLNVYNVNSKYNLESWYELNKKVIEHLYVKCNEISKTYGIDIMVNQHSFNHFIRMLYYHSEGYSIDYNLFPEYAY